MKININGKTKDIQDAASIATIVAQFGKDSKKIIAEINGTIIPSSDWDKTPVKEGDSLELVTFVGGG
jgi:sulfur carrier protein